MPGVETIPRHWIQKDRSGCFSVLSKCLSDSNLLQNALKTNFKKIERSEIKTLFTNHFLDKYTK